MELDDALDIREPEVLDLDRPRQDVAVQRVQTAYTTAMAVQQPRQLAVVERRAVEEARILGPDAFYAWGAGKDRVEGPSKELAMALVRIYGNCAVDLGAVQETADAWIFTAVFVDLETGFTLSRQFRQSKKWTVYGKFDEARKEDIRFQIGQSKAVRNVILNAVPGWLVRRAMDAAKGGVREKIEKAVASHGQAKVAERALQRLDELGAPQTRVLEAMARHAPAALTTEDLVLLYGNIAQLESGAETVEALFPVKPTTTTAPVDPPAGSTTAGAIADRVAARAGNGKQADKPAQPPVSAAAAPAGGREPEPILAEGILDGR